MVREPTCCGECGRVIVLLGGVVAAPDEIDRCDRCGKPVCESTDCQDYDPDERLCATCQFEADRAVLGEEYDDVSGEDWLGATEPAQSAAVGMDTTPGDGAGPPAGVLGELPLD